MPDPADGPPSDSCDRADDGQHLLRMDGHCALCGRYVYAHDVIDVEARDAD